MRIRLFCITHNHYYTGVTLMNINNSLGRIFVYYCIITYYICKSVCKSLHLLLAFLCSKHMF